MKPKQSPSLISPKPPLSYLPKGEKIGRKRSTFTRKLSPFGGAGGGLSFLFIFLLYLSPFWGVGGGNCFAQWSTNPAVNNAICTAVNNQQNPRIVSDGSGGAIIAWNDQRPGPNYDIYVQRIDASGVVIWTADGVAVCTNAADNFDLELISDGSGGAIIAWRDFRNVNTDIYARKIDATGAVQWTADGVAISTNVSNQSNVQLVSDGSGGAIIAWLDDRNGNYDIYAQRIDNLGAVLWAADGVAICTDATTDQSAPQIVSDGSGGAIIVWGDFRGGVAKIYAQKINAGVVQWAADGLAVSTAGVELNPQPVSDGSGGAIIVWQYFFGNNYLYAQRINGSGAKQWAAAGVAICTAVNDRKNAQLVSDGSSNGAIITWQDDRSAIGNWDIYAQRINAGAVQWTANGVAICTAANVQEYPQLAPDGSNGAIITWQDLRSGGANYDIYAQRINAGAVGWAANGVTVSTAANYQVLPRIINNACSSIITWEDWRNGGSNRSIYAQAIDCNGAPLPIELLSFSANCQDETAVLNWATASETNNNYFTVERSLSPSPSGEGWAEVGTIIGAGNSSTIHNYEFVDAFPPSLVERGGGEVYYRLKQTDYNGKYEYYGPISVNCNAGQTIVVLPTISASGYFTITGLSKNSEVEVHNMLGEKVTRSVIPGGAMNLTSDSYRMDLSAQPIGIYFINIKAEKRAIHTKVIIQGHL
ncbi:MAG: T9SS type A sorting domain-containing protein [Bacteroidetes bacterium]|nr:MAG: T9SS type A sorting domain-containing protein [Bacteroidota bacterium]